MSSQQLKSNMSAVYLLLGSDAIVKGITTPDGMHVFSIYEFLELVLIGNKSRKYVKNLWKTLSRDTSKFTEVKEDLVMAVPITKMRKTKPTTGTTVMGLQALMHVLGNQVNAELRPFVETTLAHYTAGYRGMIVEVDLNARVHPQIPSFHYNFMPPIYALE